MTAEAVYPRYRCRRTPLHDRTRDRRWAARFDWRGIPVFPTMGLHHARPERARLLPLGALVEPDLRRRDRSRRQVLAAAAELAGRALPYPWRRLAPAVAGGAAHGGGGRAEPGSTDQPPFDYHAAIDLRPDGRRPHHAALRRASRRRARSLRPGLSPWLPRTPGTMLELPATEVWLETADHMPAGKVPIGERPDWDFAHGVRCRRVGSTTASRLAGTARVIWPEHGLQLT